MFSKRLNQPLVIGTKAVEKRLFLSPMAGLGHIAFRELVSDFGGYGLLFTEMCGAKKIPTENRYVSPCFRWRDEELSYLVCQIFGNDPDVMAHAARRIQAEGFFGVDINFGCSTSQICSQDCGAAVLKYPGLSVRIVAAVRKAVSIPVFVKFRTGWKDDPDVAVDMAKRFEWAGADALVFHPRVAPDRRSRPPKWEYIGMVKGAVSIPVFGNGNVFDQDDCQTMLDMTGCDGVSIGRMAIAKPWIFAEWTEGFIPGPEIYPDTALKMTKLLFEHFEPNDAMRRFRKFAMYFSGGLRFGHTLYKRILKAKDMDDINAVIDDFFRDPPDLMSGPNMNFFG